MKERINVQQLEPNSYKAMIGLENYLHLRIEQEINRINKNTGIAN